MFKVYKAVFEECELCGIVENHRKFKVNPWSVFRPQGTTGFERPRLDAFNNQVNPIQNPHLLGFSKAFSSSIREILYSNKIYECMKDFTSAEEFVHYQSMFFDKSAGTALHQDTWYLDTEPAGSLFGIWLALEDIDDSCGPFYLYEKGPSQLLSPKDYDFAELDQDSKYVSDYPDAKIFRFYAKKGDVLVWDSFNLHGAFHPTSNDKTRKSITGHFYPAGCQIKDQPIQRLFSVYDHKKPIDTSHSKIKSAGVLNPFLYSSICQTLFLLGDNARFMTKDDTSDKKLSEIRTLND